MSTPKQSRWPCRLVGRTHRPDGTPVTVNRLIDCAGDLEYAVRKALESRRDGGRPFVGESVTVHTPLHSFDYLVECEATKPWCLVLKIIS